MTQAGFDQRNRLRRLVLLIAALLISLSWLVYGFASIHVDLPDLWRPEGLRKLEYFAGLYWTFVLASLFFAKQLTRPAILAIAAGVMVAVAGPWVVFSVAMVFLGSWATGASLLWSGDEPFEVQQEREVLRLCAGLSVLEAFVYATARVGLYYPIVLVVLLLTPTLFRWRQTWSLVRRLPHCWRINANSRWDVFAESLLGFVLFCSLLLALSPEVGTDALAMHLAVATDMSVHHRFTYTPDLVAWSAMPLGADFCFAVAYNLGGEMAARLENFGFLVVLLIVLFFLGRRFTDRRADLYLVLAMFVSCSLAQFATDTVMVENLWALFCAALVSAILSYKERGGTHYLFLYSMIGGGAMMIKLGSLAFVFVSLPFLVYAVCWNQRHRSSEKKRIFVCAAAVLLAMSVIPYALAYASTGNPVFPFANAFWKSPWMNTSSNLVDPRWRASIHSTVLFDLTFKTGTYLESRAGGIGFTLLLFALPCCAVISRKWKFATVTCLAVPLLFAALTFHEVRYARYLYPGLAILSLLVVYPLSTARRLHRWLYIVFAVVAVGTTGLNYFFSPTFSEQEASFYNLTPKDRERYMQMYNRPVPIISYLNSTAPGAPVLFLDTVDIAGLKAQPYTLTWHSYLLTQAIRDAHGLARIGNVLADHSVKYVVHSLAPSTRWPVVRTEKAQRRPWVDIYVPFLFQEYLQSCTVPVFRAGEWEIRKVRPYESAPACEAPGLAKPTRD